MPNLSFNQTLESAVLDARLEKAAGVTLNQTLDSVALVFQSKVGRTLSVSTGLEAVKLVATAAVGVAPPHPEFTTARIYNLTGPVRDNGGAIFCFVGPPNKSVDWRIVEGHGTLTPFTGFTDKLGRCSARFDAAGFVERVIIGAAYVP